MGSHIVACKCPTFLEEKKPKSLIPNPNQENEISTQHYKTTQNQKGLCKNTPTPISTNSTYFC